MLVSKAAKNHNRIGRVDLSQFTYEHWFDIYSCKCQTNNCEYWGFNTCVALTQLSSAAFKCCRCLPLSEAAIGAAQDLLELMESSTDARTSCSLVHVTLPPPDGRKQNCSVKPYLTSLNSKKVDSKWTLLVSLKYFNNILRFFRTGQNRLLYWTSAAQWRFSHNWRSSVYFWDAPGHPVGQQVRNQAPRWFRGSQICSFALQ